MNQGSCFVTESSFDRDQVTIAGIIKTALKADEWVPRTTIASREGREHSKSSAETDGEREQLQTKHGKIHDTHLFQSTKFDWIFVATPDVQILSYPCPPPPISSPILPRRIHRAASSPPHAEPEKTLRFAFKIDWDLRDHTQRLGVFRILSFGNERRSSRRGASHRSNDLGPIR